MICTRCGGPLVPSRRGEYHYCPLCAASKPTGKAKRKALRVMERPALQALFRPQPDPVADAERAYRLRVLALAYYGDPDALLSLWDHWGVRLPLVEAQTGWVPPRPRPRREGGDRPWLAEIGA